MDQRFVFSGLALEIVVALGALSLILLSYAVDILTVSELYLFWARASLVLTPTSLVLVSAGLSLKRTIQAQVKLQVVTILCWLAILGTLASALSIFLINLGILDDCYPMTLWKCNMAKAGTYVGYTFLPAIAIPIVTLVYVSRIRHPTCSSEIA